jgi:hypothetical protein
MWNFLSFEREDRGCLIRINESGHYILWGVFSTICYIFGCTVRAVSEPVRPPRGSITIIIEAARSPSHPTGKVVDGEPKAPILLNSVL